MANDKERAKIKHRYQAAIESTAMILANGWNSASIRQADPTAALYFDMQLGELQALDLEPEVNRRRDEILAERKK